LTTYALLPQWTTAGRYGDPVGPRYSVAQILNTSRYGPQALTGSSPSVTQQPQNQTVTAGSSATFSVQVTGGSNLIYQWMTSTNGGNTWSVVQNAQSATLTLSNVPSTDNGDEFWCLVSGIGGSTWSNPATLTVTSYVSAVVAAGPGPAAGASVAASSGYGLLASGATDSGTLTVSVPTGAPNSAPGNVGTVSPATGHAKAISSPTPTGPVRFQAASHSTLVYGLSGTTSQRLTTLKRLSLLPGEDNT
jgi:hypothetical protein